MSCVIQTSASCIVPSTVLPIDVEYARLYLKSISDTEDALIESWIKAAAEYIEEETGRSIMRATFEYWLDAFPSESAIELPHPPLVDVLAVEYVTSDGTVASFDDGASPLTRYWQVRAPAGTFARRGWIFPAVGSVWPSTARAETGAVRIRYTAGYATTPDEVPEIIRATLLRIVGQYEQFRSEIHYSETGRIEQLPFSVDHALFKLKWSAASSQELHRP